VKERTRELAAVNPAAQEASGNWKKRSGSLMWDIGSVIWIPAFLRGPMKSIEFSVCRPQEKQVYFQTVPDLIDAGDRARVAHLIAESRARNLGATPSISGLRARTVKRGTFAAKGEVLRNNLGRPFREFGILRDITDRKRV